MQRTPSSSGRPLKVIRQTTPHHLLHFSLYGVIARGCATMATNRLVLQAHLAAKVSSRLHECLSVLHGPDLQSKARRNFQASMCWLMWAILGSCTQ